MLHLVDLVTKWREAASEIAQYTSASEAADVLVACAAELEEAFETDLGRWVPTDVASKLAGRPKGELRRYARKAFGNAHSPVSVRKSGSGRWLFYVSDLQALDNSGRTHVVEAA